MRFLIRLVLIVALFTTVLAGCDSGTGKRVGQKVDDASITAGNRTAGVCEMVERAV
jgi:predicted small secreted protein